MPKIVQRNFQILGFRNLLEKNVFRKIVKANSVWLSFVNASLPIYQELLNFLLWVFFCEGRLRSLSTSLAILRSTWDNSRVLGMTREYSS
ncbi:hypothetical protein QVD17_39894 [Tagetes erecta]|uniref:Uncharacterized protein n=1 Tax=Tagetes erecta TaxID=13708 RepID=A0AAD8NHL8_TARER|nr:hypothetical protein QVD17_39894 [Tagetes erecta]